MSELFRSPTEIVNDLFEAYGRGDNSLIVQKYMDEFQLTARQQAGFRDMTKQFVIQANRNDTRPLEAIVSKGSLTSYRNAEIVQKAAQNHGGSIRALERSVRDLASPDDHKRLAAFRDLCEKPVHVDDSYGMVFYGDWTVEHFDARLAYLQRIIDKGVTSREYTKTNRQLLIASGATRFRDISDISSVNLGLGLDNISLKA